MTDLSITDYSVEKLIPYVRNARTHSDEQIAQIMASIAEFGFVNPILVDSRDGIVAGHGRLLAARKLGLAEVPVIVLDHLSETQRRAYVLADNRLALPASALAGALLALLADTIARMALSPRELPTGAITALLGAPLFIYLLLRNR